MGNRLDRNYPAYLLAGGMLSLVIVMGIGRFAYTPILPLMTHSAGLSEAAAGYLSSYNYIGYLFGSLAAGMLPWRRGKVFYLKLNLLVNVLTTALMGAVSGFALWSVLRFVSGFSSGLVFVFATGIVLDGLALRGRSSWSGWLYSGVGLGIVLSGWLVPALNDFGGWKWAWGGLGSVSILLGAFPLLFLKEPQTASSKNAPIERDHQDSTGNRGMLMRLIVAYGCEGMGYIVSATFLVAIVEQMPEVREFSALSWVFVGVAAAPSCWIWSWIEKKKGSMSALYAAFCTQIFGVILPVLFPNAIGVLTGAFLFGATFMGITMLTMSLARGMFPQESSTIIGYATAVYGAGQIIGPIVTGVLMVNTGSYDGALVFASLTLLCGLIVLVTGHERVRAAG
ncbi:YbfB/YjiJ family MFS transporter [Paenibacillus sp. OSY-SE]|uniref:YbfB/YjiJ family MFS transporter n=1 Tax=Paenibacillus sp. OSY-SE TaxID=1196323 RepID=UPI0002FEA3FE|nr:YbfB/YjiJ family MFS transporter [Paenibacillus sp. OSY-SE]